MPYDYTFVVNNNEDFVIDNDGNFVILTAVYYESGAGSVHVTDVTEVRKRFYITLELDVDGILAVPIFLTYDVIGRIKKILLNWLSVIGKTKRLNEVLSFNLLGIVSTPTQELFHIKGISSKPMLQKLIDIKGISTQDTLSLFIVIGIKKKLIRQDYNLSACSKTLFEKRYNISSVAKRSTELETLLKGIRKNNLNREFEVSGKRNFRKIKEIISIIDAEI